MKILIDLTSLDDNFSGIERFALSITKSLIKLDNDYSNQYILLFKNKIHEEFINLPSYVTVVVLKGKTNFYLIKLYCPLIFMEYRQIVISSQHFQPHSFYLKIIKLIPFMM